MEITVVIFNQFFFLVQGILGCLTTVAIGAYRFKNRNKQFPISVYLIQLRVAAQSAVIGTLTLGMTYGMLNEYVFNKKSKPGIQEK